MEYGLGLTRFTLALAATTALLASCRTSDSAASAVQDAVVNGNYSGAQMISYETFLYGAFEARIKAGKGSGVITPFFLYKMSGGGWQEMDFEIFGKNGQFQTQVMTPGNPRTQHLVAEQLPKGQLAYDDYHVYRMEWSPTALSFYLDGALIRRETDPQLYAEFFDKTQTGAMNIFINIWAMNNDWAGLFDPTAVPAYALATYVQAETYTPGKGPGGSDFTVEWRDNFSYLNTQRWQVSSGKLDGAVNSWAPGNASTRNNNLILYFSN